ncbi:MAG: DUF3883 domain-containing protein [Candidatus Paceibacterota bacterium]
MKSNFADISLRQILSLFSSIRELNDKSLHKVEFIYRKNGLNFVTTLNFTQGLNLINVNNGKLKITDNYNLLANDPEVSDEKVKEIIINSILIEENKFKSEAFDYLDKFKLGSTSFEYRPNTKDNIKYSSIRNFLVEIGLVEYNSKKQTYSIAHNYIERFVTGIKGPTLHPDTLKMLLQKKEELGELAEKTILNFEKNRLSKFPDLINKIRHVASENVTAGYDIKSWDVDKTRNNSITERYIEVKAVSLDGLKFYWSKNEIEKAKEFGKKYYLYLLPVISGKGFDINELNIISDPYTEVYLNKKWDRQAESYLFKNS